MPSATESNAPAHIPAWKRLGLKLKSAQDSPSTAVEPSIESPKRKRPEDTKDDTPSKKVKQAPKIHSDSAQDPITPQLARKKSVTFTPETKAEDGDSIKQLFNAWVAEQKFQDPSFELKNSNPAFQTPEPSKVDGEIDATLDEKERKLKRVKKPKKEKTTPKPGRPPKITKSPAASTRPFLQYLRRYYESKHTWKFNKNHQNHLIRSIFSIDAIPSDHAHFIYPYVRGLQGRVRTRLRDAALAVKVKDQEDGPAGFPANMPEPEKRQREYDSAMKEYVATMIATHNTQTEMGYEEGILLGLSDNAMRERAAKKMRLERILYELGSTEDTKGNTDRELVSVDDEHQKKLRIDDGSLQKVARKRKQRTVVADEESSSSGDSSESESESDSDISEESTAQNHGADYTSSSSSSSSSGSEDDEDSENDSSDSSDSSDESEDSDSD